jgi:hypothetical protein
MNKGHKTAQKFIHHVGSSSSVVGISIDCNCLVVILLLIIANNAAPQSSRVAFPIF